jgi:hypothetical protein
MTTRITSGGPPTYVAAVPTAARTTAPPSRPFQQLISSSASAIMQSAEQAATHLPGGPILAAAMRPSQRGTQVSPGQSPEGATSALGGSPGLGGAAVGGWSSALAGSTVEDPVRRRFHDEIDAGRILLVLDAESPQLAAAEAALVASGATPLPYETMTALT